jgi:hypothetical protein
MWPWRIIALAIVQAGLGESGPAPDREQAPRSLHGAAFGGEGADIGHFEFERGVGMAGPQRRVRGMPQALSSMVAMKPPCTVPIGL